MILLSVVFLSFVATSLGVYGALCYLRDRAILDNPNHRSSHSIPTPRGGGLGIIPLLVICMGSFIYSGILSDPSVDVWIILVIGLMGLSFISWWDDRRAKGIPARWRFLMQFLAASAPLIFLPSDMRLLPSWLPLMAERGLLVVVWIWFINIYNFMDGINGQTGVQTSVMNIGMIILGLMGVSLAPGVMLLNAVITGSALGFLVWNFRKQALIFLGDIGSIGFGYVVGFLLILLAHQPNGFVPALLLPLYYVMDATITLLKRLKRGEKFWQPHRQHFYQQATVPGGLSHRRTVRIIGGVNIIMIALSAWALKSPVLALGAGIVFVGAELLYFRHIRRSQRRV